MSLSINRRDLFKVGGVLSGSLLLRQWKQISEWESDIKAFATSNDSSLARLCYNENPYGPSPKVKEFLNKNIAGAHIYPFGDIEKLASRLAEKHGVSREHIVVTAGSREGLNAAALTFASSGKEVISCMPTYKALLDYAVQQNGRLISLPLGEDYAFDLEAIENAITEETGLIFLCNPNNPTGALLDGTKVTKWCTRVSERVPVFADEVYYDYIQTPNYPTMIDLVKKNQSVIVARTFSKIYGLAGIRVGYLVARPDLASKIRDNLQANTNIIGAWAALASLEDDEFYKESLHKNKTALEMIYTSCDKLGLPYVSSHTNFVFIHTGISNDTFQSRMKDRGVLTGRPFPPYLDWARVSTGHLKDVEKFTQVLPEVMKA